MTCVVVVVQSNAVHMFADSAAIGPTGKLVASAPKIMQFEHAQMCAVVRGSVTHSWRLRRIIEQFESYDEARAGIVGRLRSPLWRVFGACELYIVGISAGGQPAALMVATHARHEGIEPWAMVDVPFVVTTGPAPDLDAERDPIAFGVRAAELQRAVLQKLPFSRTPASIVGGFLQHVVISPSGVTSRVLGGWHDRLGERLNPSARFTASGAGVRKAARRGLLAMRQWRVAALLLTAWIALAAIMIGPNIPALVRLQTSYGNASEDLETSDGPWTIWARPDALVTSPRWDRVAREAWNHSPATAAQHDAAAAEWLARQGRKCMLIGSVEVASATFQHFYRCD